MDAELAFEQLPPRIELLQSLANDFARAVVTAKIEKSLFALENGGASGAVSVCSVGRQIDAVAAAGQTYFVRAGGVALRLCPNEGQTLEPTVSFRFAARACGGRRGACRWVTLAADTPKAFGATEGRGNHPRVH